MGFIDFAGSTVVHSIGGWCALAALIVIKPRLGRYAPDGTPRNIPGHNLSSATLGALILWLGWFGFNGGSVALLPGGTDISIGQVVVNTHLGGTAGALGAIAAMVFFRNKILLTVVLNGSVAGLVSQRMSISGLWRCNSTIAASVAALALGIVNRVVPAVELEAATFAIAEQLANAAPQALRGILDAVLIGGESPIDVGLDYETQGFAIAFSTEDMKEGTGAFLAKRKPSFTGR